MQMRTVDVARRAGYSVQQVRNLERDGVLPPATRTATGYRIYAEVHLQSVLAYRALAAGVGPTEAKKIVRAVHHGPASQVLALLDAAHPTQVRDARIVHQLRRAGYRIAALRALMPQLRHARRSEDVASALAARDASIAARSKALLDGSAALSAVLALTTSDDTTTGDGTSAPRDPAEAKPA